MRTILLSALVGLLVLANGCEEIPQRSYAYKITNRGQLIGGPGAIGDLGDFMIENGKIRAIIQDVGFSRGNAIFGGSLIDADIVRPKGHPGSADSGGKDAFGEMFPAFFLEAQEPEQVEILADGSDDDGIAKIRVVGHANEFLAMTQQLLHLLVPWDRLRLETIYILKPGVNYVEITSKVINVDPYGASVSFHNIEFGGTKVPIPMGDGLLLGKKVKAFVPGDGGFDQEMALDARYAVPIGLPALPGLRAEFIASHGDDVSYGLLPKPSGEGNMIYKLREQYQDYPGKVTDNSLVIPFSASGLAPVYYAWPPDELGQYEEFAFTRYFIVGTGDVATVSDTVYEILKDDVGTFSGRVRETTSLYPVSDASVVVFDGNGQPLTQMDTDPDGYFSCKLRPGDYSVSVVKKDRQTTRPKRFAIKKSQKTYLDLSIHAAARFTVSVSDDHGRRIPARATLVGISDVQDMNMPAHMVLYHPGIGEPKRTTDMEWDTEDPQTRRYIESIHYGTDGIISGEGRPGTYVLYVSRGPEYSVSVAENVELKPNKTLAIEAILRRVVDTSGYISADFHIHSDGSADSSAKKRPRLIEAAGEGLEIPVSTDHNFVVDYAATIAALDLEKWMKSIVGIELTTLEMGHFNAFPLRYQVGPVTHGSFFWQTMPAQKIFDRLRDMGDGSTVIQVNHARDYLLGYFYQFRVHPETLEVQGQGGGLLSPQPDTHPEFLPENFSWDFDALEILNGKMVEQIHTFRVPEELPPPPLPDNIPAAGEILRDEEGEIAFPGMVEDWLNLLAHGKVYTALANSDSHKLGRGNEVGYPRTFVGVPQDDPAKPDIVDDVMAGVHGHRAVLSYCPFIRMTVGNKTVGDTVVPENGLVQLKVDVQTSSFCHPDQLNIYMGTEIVAQRMIPPESARHFVASFVLPVGSDNFIVAEVVGSSSTFPVIPGNETPSTEFSKALGSIAGSIGFSFDDWGNLRPQRRHIQTPYAITNPIFVDADDNGSWAPIVTSTQPLDTEDSDENSQTKGGAKRAPKLLLPAHSVVDHPLFHVPLKTSNSDIRVMAVQRSCSQ